MPLAEPYEKLKEKLNNAIKKKDPNEIEESLKKIDDEISPEKIPPEDRKLIEQARELQKSLRNPQRILFYFFIS